MTSMTMFQAGVRKWMTECFSLTTRTNRRERAFRFLEESLELFQAVGCTEKEARELVSYVFNRPVGVTYQEVGGVMVTLAALCSATDVNLNMAAVDELNRVNDPEVMAKIKTKRATRAVPGDYNAE